MMDFNQMKISWNKFYENGVIPSSVKPYIAESWKRCRKRGLDPMGDGNAEPITPSALDECLQKNEGLSTIASPVIQMLYRKIPFPIDCIWFTDQNTIILNLYGSPKTINQYKQDNFYPGIYWGEDVVGTNAVDLAIRTDDLIQTVGAEHYFKNHHDFCCTAIPIHSPDKDILGCLCISLPIAQITDTNKLDLLKMIVSIGAYSIEQQIELAHMAEINQQIMDSMFDGVLTVDRDFHIISINDSGQEILGISEEEILHKDLTSFMPHIAEWKILVEQSETYSGELLFDIYGQPKRCHGTVNALRVRYQRAGAVLTFKGEKYFHKSVNKALGNKSYYNFDQIITANKKMQETLNDARRIANTSCNILILGESGTGKEMLAQSIHSSSYRANEPLVTVNCAALPRDLVESELFGYEKGAFTGAASEGRPGKFELAHKGTLFLDEIGELPLEIQPKLLRAIETRRVSRIGGKYEKLVDIRLICATNRTLSKEVAQKTFRSDLFYRINVINLRIPPLKERPEDIPLLAAHFLARLNQENKTKKRFSSGYLETLKKIRWSGNVRELENAITQSYYLTGENLQVISRIAGEYLEEQQEDKSFSSSLMAVAPMENVERTMIVNALIQKKGNILEAASALELGKSTLYRKIKKYGISKEEYMEDLFPPSIPRR